MDDVFDGLEDDVLYFDELDRFGEGELGSGGTSGLESDGELYGSATHGKPANKGKKRGTGRSKRERKTWRIWNSPRAYAADEGASGVHLMPKGNANRKKVRG